MLPTIDIGFVNFRIWDVFDILIVGYLMYQLYKLLRGSIAFNIFIGIILIYVASWLVKALQMDLLSNLLGAFVSVGVLMLLIIFQPEVRRFLLLLGNTTLRQRSNFLSRLLDRQLKTTPQGNQKLVKAIKNAMLRMSRDKTGALIVLANNLHLEFFSDSGVVLDAKISQPLIESIFNKESPLHDGAVVITDQLIHAASCVLPLSSSSGLPKSAGLRHRAGVGVTENNTNVSAFIVSEESGDIAYAYEGRLQRKLGEKVLEELLTKHFNDTL